jgi:hypothetical protein
MTAAVEARLAMFGAGHEVEWDPKP